MEARNELESYAYSLKNQINDKEKLGGKLAEDDKKTIEEAVDEAIDWLGKNLEASVEDLQEQKKVGNEANNFLLMEKTHAPFIVINLKIFIRILHYTIVDWIVESIMISLKNHLISESSSSKFGNEITNIDFFQDLEGKVQPIISKLYAGQAPPEGGEEEAAGGSDDKDEL